MRVPIVLPATLLFALSACGGGGEGPPDDASPSNHFAFGVEYMEDGLASAYGATGVGWAKTRLESFEWGAIEPAAPIGGVHTYDWACTDQSIAAYQAAGMTNIQSYLSPASSWGNVGIGGDIMPSPAHMADYRAWVRALIERYDGDGSADMPGLLAPVREWVVGPEWTGFWPSADVDDYIELLRITGEEARAASPDVVLGTIPFQLVDVFEGNEPSQSEIDARLAASAPIGRNHADGVLAILDRPDLFDAVSIHSLGDYTEIAPTLRWFREQMAARGYQRPLWFDDAFPMSLLANVAWPIMYPLTDESDRAPMLEILDAIADLDSDEHATNKAWLEGQVASSLARKVVSAMGEGSAGIMIGNTEDWMHDTNVPLRRFSTSLIGAAAMMGAIDVTHPSGEYDHCALRVAGDPRPAWYAIEQCARHVGDGGYERVERLGQLTGLRGYVVFTTDSWWAALWYEDDVLQLPGEVEPLTPTSISLPVPDGPLTWERTVTAGTTPDTGAATLVSGTLTLPLDSAPIFVRPATP